MATNSVEDKTIPILAIAVIDDRTFLMIALMQVFMYTDMGDDLGMIYGTNN